MTRSFRSSALCLVLVAFICAVTSSAFGLAAGTPPLPTRQIDPSKLVSYRNSIPSQVASSSDQGRAGSTEIQGTIGLSRSPELGQAVELLEKRIQDPNDSMYHQWLTPEELGRNFPANPDSVAKITQWLQSYGLSVVSVDQPRLLLTFSGPASAVENAFHTEIHLFTAPDGTFHYANVTNPKVAGSMYALVGSFRLDNFSTEQKNYAGAVVAPKAVSLVALKPITAEVAAKTATGTEPLQSLGFTITPGFQKPGTPTPQTLTVTYAAKPGQDAPTGKISIGGDEKLGNIGMADLQSCKSASGTEFTCAYQWTPAADMPAGEHKITASYSGDGKYAPAFTSAAIKSDGTTATSTTIAASTINQAASSNITFTSVTTWTGSGSTPTGTITLSCNTTYSPTTCTGAPAAVNVSTCTISTTAKTITCAIPWNLYNSTVDFGGYAVVATYSGDTTYAGSNNLIFVDENEDLGLGSVSVTASPLYTAPGSGATITYTVIFTASTYTNNPTQFQPYDVLLTGLPITGSQTVGASTGCTWNAATLQATCTVTSAVPTTLAAGTYPIVVEFGGNLLDEAEVGGTTLQITAASLTNTVGVGLTPNTVAYASGTAVTVAVTNTWVGTTAPTGTITLTDANAYLPTQVINLSTCTAGTNTYTCSYTWTVASTVQVSPDKVTATYSGDSNFTPSSGSANLTVTGIGSGTVALGSLADSLTPTSQTYGNSVTLTLGTTLTGKAADGFPTGTVSYALGSATTEQYVLTNSTLPSTHCVESGTDKITCTGVTAATPATLPVGAYREWNNYSGNSLYALATYLGSATAFTVNKQTPTFGTMSFSPAATEPYGTSQAITISDTLLYTGSGVAPTGAVTFVLNAVTYTATCTGSSSPLTCTATVPAATIAALAVKAYTVTGAYATDTNYAAATATSGTFTISQATPTFGTMTFSPASSVTVGTSEAITISDTLSYTASSAPTGAVTYKLNGVTYTATCSGSSSPLTCTATVPAATIAALAANTYTVTAALAAGGNYAGATGTSGTFTVTNAVNLTFTSVSHNFGQVAVGTAATSYGISITNSNTVAYPFNLVFTAANGFTSATNCGNSIAAGAKCELVFYFTPTANGPVSATWSLAPETGFYYGPSNGGTLQGSGTGGGGVSLTTNGHNFGVLANGTQSATYGTELSNSTSSAVTLSLGSVSAPFTAITNCGSTLAAGASCELEFYATGNSSTTTTTQVYTLSAGGVTITSGGAALPNGGITLTGN